MESLGKVKATVAHGESYTRELARPILGDMERLAAIAAKAVLRHVEIEGNLVAGQLQEAIRVALVADMTRSTDARARCNLDGPRRPAGACLDDLQKQIRELS